jgi:hypothetical protein
MAIVDIIAQRIKEEIENDPYKRGYAGKSDDEIAKLMNEPFFTEKTVQEYCMPRITEIINAIPSAANTVEKEDISTAKVFIAKPIKEIIAE